MTTPTVDSIYNRLKELDPEDVHELSSHWRMALIDAGPDTPYGWEDGNYGTYNPTYVPPPQEMRDEVDAIIASLFSVPDSWDLAWGPYPSTRQLLSELCLGESLCPMHRVDYAICFDDDDPECAAIRAVFPAHDT